jgi:SAM-dependent methyltransferase
LDEQLTFMSLKLFFIRNFSPRALKNKFLNVALKGDTVECVCCNKKFITFLPAGIEKRANAKCANCGSLERHRILWHFLTHQTKLFSDNIKLLHPAPEKLFYQKFKLHRNIEYTSIDLNPDKYDYGSTTIKMDLTNLTFNNDSFDVIICNHVLEHIPDDAKAMSEMYRVLKPGGWALLNVPVDNSRATTFEDIHINDPKKQLELFGQPDHVRVYGRDYKDRLEKAGFVVTLIDYTKQFSHNEKFRFGMKDEREIYYCTKPQ